MTSPSPSPVPQRTIGILLANPPRPCSCGSPAYWIDPYGRLHCLVCRPPAAASMKRHRLDVLTEPGRMIWSLDGVPVPPEAIGDSGGILVNPVGCGSGGSGDDPAPPPDPPGLPPEQKNFYQQKNHGEEKNFFGSGPPADLPSPATPEQKNFSGEKKTSEEKKFFDPAIKSPAGPIRVPMNKKIFVLVKRGKEKILHLPDKPNRSDEIYRITWEGAERWYGPEEVVVSDADLFGKAATPATAKATSGKAASKSATKSPARAAKTAARSADLDLLPDADQSGWSEDTDDALPQDELPGDPGD